jgi:hypothetical protein
MEMKLAALAAAVCLLGTGQVAQATLVASYGVGAAATTANEQFVQRLDTDTQAIDSLEDPTNDRGWGGSDFASPPLVGETPLELRFDSVGTPFTKLGGIAGTSQITRVSSDGRAAHAGEYYFQGQDFEITFVDAVSAFGFWGSDIGDFDGCPLGDTNCLRVGGRGLTVTLLDADGKSLTADPIAIDGSDSGGVLFWGIVDTGGANIAKVVFHDRSGGVDIQGFDDFTIGAVDPDFVTDPPPNRTPEPGALALAGLALAGASWARRRRS